MSAMLLPSWKDPPRGPGETTDDVEQRLRNRIAMCERRLAEVDTIVISAKAWAKQPTGDTVKALLDAVARLKEIEAQRIGEVAR